MFITELPWDLPEAYRKESNLTFWNEQDNCTRQDSCNNGWYRGYHDEILSGVDLTLPVTCMVFRRLCLQETIPDLLVELFRIIYNLWLRLIWTLDQKSMLNFRFCIRFALATMLTSCSFYLDCWRFKVFLIYQQHKVVISVNCFFPLLYLL